MIEAIMEFISEVIFEGLMLGLFRLAKFIGIVVLKIITLNPKPVEELKEKYKDSFKPYFIGFGLIIGLIYLLIQMI